MLSFALLVHLHPVAFYVRFRGLGISPIDVILDRIRNFPFYTDSHLDACRLQHTKGFGSAISCEDHIRLMREKVLCGLNSRTLSKIQTLSILNDLEVPCLRINDEKVLGPPKPGIDLGFKAIAIGCYCYYHFLCPPAQRILDR
jgi:hypothetical protein